MGISCICLHVCKCQSRYTKRNLKSASVSIKKKKIISGVDFAGCSPTFIHLLPRLHIKQLIASHLEEAGKTLKKNACGNQIPAPGLHISTCKGRQLF